MTINLTVAVLHPGQMGAAVAAELRRRDIAVRWLPTGRGPATTKRAEEAGLAPAPDLAALLADSDLVLSICPPAAAEDVASQVAAHAFTGVYVDANAISPARSLRIADRVGASGARFVDGGIIGPPPGIDRPTHLYLSGDTSDVGVVTTLFSDTSVRTTALDNAERGAASALKMAFASYQKIRRALVGVAHALADQYGVTDHLLDRGAGTALADVDNLPTVAARAWRWWPEMLEIGDTLEAEQLPPDLARAAANVFRHWESAKDTEPPVSEVLAALRDPARD